MIKTISKTTKTFVLEILKYGLEASQYERISTKDLVIKYNGGENWNSAYNNDWYDLYIPIVLPKHNIINKTDMVGGELEVYNLKQFNMLLQNIHAALKNHFTIDTVFNSNTDFSIGNNMLYVQMCVWPR